MQTENVQKLNWFFIIRNIDLELRKRCALNTFILSSDPPIKVSSENSLDVKLKN